MNQKKHGPAPKILTKDNLMSFTKQEGDCLVWTGARTPFGYGTCGWRYRGVHRLSYSLFVGPIPEGMCVCHKCDNPPCINPAHLFVGSHADNMADKMSKGRGGRAGRKSGGYLTGDQVCNLRAEAATTHRKVLAAKYGISLSHVHNILANRRRQKTT